MNRLIRIMCAFVLPFLCFLINVSYAEYNSSSPSPGQASYSQADTSLIDLCGYTASQIPSIFDDRENNPDAYNTLLSTFTDNGYYIYFPGWRYSSTVKPTGFVIIPTSTFRDIGVSSSGSLMPYFKINDIFGHYATSISSPSFKVYKATSEGHLAINSMSNCSSSLDMFGNLPYVKQLYSNNGIYWDGESYYYQAPKPDIPDTPSLPSNAEIAQAVQAFYNSDYYKNNKNFSDFFALYNYENSTFSFIGHNFGIDLGQVIVPPDYEYEGYSYNQDWWKFFLRNISSELASNLWNKYYWLYSTTDFGENIKSDGKGSIKDLINLHFSTNSIIVYSTTDYPVVKIETDENGVLTPVEGTIPGDQYTYDENLDPTTNEYNPLENFVPSNPVQSILGDVNFDEINKTFEENKDLLNIEGASWLFTANNKLVGYFVGFLSLLIVFLIISRILGG